MSESTQTSRAYLCDLKRIVPVLFFAKSRKERLDKQAWGSLTPSHPTPPPNCSFPPEKCCIWIHEIRETPCYTAKNSGVGWGGGEWGERTLGLFVKSFLPAFREKQHGNIFSHHTGRLAKFGWILTYLKISVEMAAVTRDSCLEPFNYLEMTIDLFHCKVTKGRPVHYSIWTHYTLDFPITAQ